MTITDSGVEYRPLGYDRQTYYVMPRGTKQVQSYSAAQLMSRAGCMTIVPDYSYWMESFAHRGNVDWATAGAQIMRQCQEAGVYDPKCIRARGVWLDSGRTVVNLGDTMTVDGVIVDPVEFRTRYVYERATALPPMAPPMTDARPILDLCRKARWFNPMYGDLLAGWLAIAPICGALQPPHLWIAGDVPDERLSALEGVFAAVLGGVVTDGMQSRPADTKSVIGNDALPVLFRERHGKTPLMAKAAMVEPNMRSAIAVVASTAATSMPSAVILTVRNDVAVNDAQRLEHELEWKALGLACQTINTSGLMARQVQNLDAIIANTETFRTVIAAHIGNQHGDRFAVLMAGVYSLTTGAIVSAADAAKFISDYDWLEFTAANGERTDRLLLQHIMGRPIEIPRPKGPIQRTVRQLINIVLNRADDREVGMVMAESMLAKNGLRKDGAGIWVATGLNAIGVLLGVGNWREREWFRPLTLDKTTYKSGGSMRFGPHMSRAIYVPRTSWR